MTRFVVSPHDVWLAPSSGHEGWAIGCCDRRLGVPPCLRPLDIYNLSPSAMSTALE